MNAIKILILILAFCPIVFTQQIIVTDCITRHPIAGVVVFSGTTAYTKTTEDGAFSLPHGVVDTQIIAFTHVAYASQKYTIKDLRQLQSICLFPSVVTTDSILIHAPFKEKSTSGSSVQMQLTQADRVTSFSADEILYKQTDLFVKEYGGFGALKTVSSRGLSSENTMVLFNNARVNDLATGTFDFSRLGLYSIQKIVYRKNDEGNSASTSAGGVLEISTNENEFNHQTQAGVRLSSDGLRAVQASFVQTFNSLSIHATMDRSYSNNNYPYRFEGKKYTRENAFFSKSNFELDSRFVLPNGLVTFYNSIHSLKNGIPGVVVTNNQSEGHATNSSVTHTHIANLYMGLNNWSSIQTTLYYQGQELSINDPDGILVFTSDKKVSQMKNTGLTLKTSVGKNGIQMTAGLELHYGTLHNAAAFIAGENAFNTLTKLSYRSFLSGRYMHHLPVLGINQMIISGLLAYEYETEQANKRKYQSGVSEKVGLSILTAMSDNLWLKFNAGDDFRNPTFYERYYSALYSIYDLHREEYQWYDAGIELSASTDIPVDCKLIYYAIQGSNKIVWMPTRLGLQTPRNITATRLTGVELSGSIWLPDSLLQLQGTYNFTSALNKTRLSADDVSFNKQLIYTPKHRSRVQLLYQTSSINITAGISYVDQSYYTADNNPLYLLKGYAILDASASYEFAIAGFKHRFGCTAYNINNQSYFIIQSYPMPLRTFLISYQMEIQ